MLWAIVVRALLLNLWHEKNRHLLEDKFSCLDSFCSNTHSFASWCGAQRIEFFL